MALGRLKIRIPLLFRIIVLRILLLSTLAALIIYVFVGISDVQRGSPVYVLDWLAGVVVPITIIIHHTFRLWPKKYWLIICEVVTSLLEVGIAGLLFATKLPTTIIGMKAGDKFDTGLSLAMMNGGISFVMAISCFIAFVILLYDTLRDCGLKKILRPYDFSAGSCPLPNHQWNFICGDFVTRKRFSTDNPFIQSIRAVLAFLGLFVISAVVVYALILQPTERSGRQGVKISKITVPDGHFSDTLLTAIGKLDSVFLLPPQLQAVLTGGNVSASSPTMSLTQSFVARPGHILLHDECRKSTDSSGTVLAICAYAYIPISSEEIIDILITIYFPEMLDGLRVYLGMTDSTDDILGGARPISIIPGSNLYGLSSISLKEQFLSQGAATFGIPQYRRFTVINVHTLFPDPLPTLPRGNNTATLRIRVQSQSDIEIEQGYVDGSVINGFALVGGVWTLVNGIFAAVFGSTLLLVLFGIKPLSIYGLVHFFRPGKGSLADGGYTLSSEERDRTVGILREHLLDVEAAAGDGTSPPPIRYSPVNA